MVLGFESSQNCQHVDLDGAAGDEAKDANTAVSTDAIKKRLHRRKQIFNG